MIVREDVDNARGWLRIHCRHSHIRATLLKALAYVEAIENAGLDVEAVDRDDLHGFLADAANTETFRKHFVQPTL